MLGIKTRAKSSQSKGETAMKKLMTLMLGLAFLTTTVVVTFAQDTATTKTKKAKKAKKTADTTKKSLF